MRSKSFLWNQTKAKDKAWFGIEQSFKQLDKVWTILSESSQFAHEQLERMKHDADWEGEDQEPCPAQSVLRCVLNRSFVCSLHNIANQHLVYRFVRVF